MAHTTNNKQRKAEQAFLSIKRLAQSNSDKTLMTDDQLLEFLAELVGKTRPHRKAHAMAVLHDFRSAPIKKEKLRSPEWATIQSIKAIKNGKVNVLMVKGPSGNYQIHLPKTESKDLSKGSTMLVNFRNDVPAFMGSTQKTISAKVAKVYNKSGVINVVGENGIKYAFFSKLAFTTGDNIMIRVTSGTFTGTKTEYLSTTKKVK